MDLINLSTQAALIIVVLGMAVVFAGLIMLMFVVKLMSKVLSRGKAEAAEDTETAGLQNTEAARAPKAPGTAGELNLYNTDPKDAAMVMAIVADSLGKPLNELRFKSIREIGGQTGDGETGD